MASYYVHSGATGGGTGVDWANAYTTLSAAVSGKAAGDVFYVAHDHAETTASAVTINPGGTDIAPSRIYCVNRAGSVPPVSADLRTTATVSTTGASGISLVNTLAECYGIAFSAGDAAGIANVVVNSTNTGRALRLINCQLKLGSTSTSSLIVLAQSGNPGLVVMENTTVQFGNVSQGISIGGRVYWRNTPNAVSGSIFPTSLFRGGSATQLFIEGVDLSALAGNTLVNAGSSAAPQTYALKDCKLGSGTTISSTPSSIAGAETAIIRCDSGDTNYRTEKYNYLGTLTTETTIVRSGGASDGTTPISWKIITTASSRWELPFECLPITIWQETTGSAITVTVQGIWGGGSVPNNDDIWIDVEYLGTSGFPLASKGTSTKADSLASGSAIPAGSGTWGGSTTKFAMSVTLTPQEKGPLTIYVKAAKASSTFYVDPKPVVT